MRGRSRKSEERLNVWPGFTDVMVGLLLIFLLVVTLFTISETILGRSLSKKDIELARLKKEAAEKTLEIERLRKERDVKTTEAEGLSRDIAKRITEIEILTREADEKASQIETLRSDVSRKAAEIQDLQKQIVEKTQEAGRLAQELASKAAEAQSLLWQNELKGGALERLKVEIDRLEQLAADQQTKIAGLEDLFAARTKELETATAEVQTKTALAKEKDKLLEQRRQEIESALAKLKEKTALLARKERRINELDARLGKRGAELTGARSEISKKAKSINDLTAALEAQNKRIAELNKRIATYAGEVKRLNNLLAEAKESEATQKTKAASLQKEIVSLHAQLEEIAGKLSSAEENAKKKFRISQLVGLLGEKEKEIERLRKLAKYRSEFLAKLESVFAGVQDIKVQGDRFVFQSEILFASGSATINEAGKKELDKFIKIYKEMESKVPKDLDLIILVQGYTDTDPVRSSRYRSNWELSSERSLQVVRYMIEKGVPPTALGASALGEFHPVSRKETPEAKRFNRRIEIKITTL